MKKVRLRGGEVGEIGIVQSCVGTHQPLAIETGQPLLDVGGVLGTALLPIIDHVDAGVLLPGNDLTHCISDAGKEVSLIKIALILALPEQFL